MEIWAFPETFIKSKQTQRNKATDGLDYFVHSTIDCQQQSLQGFSLEKPNSTSVMKTGPTSLSVFYLHYSQYYLLKPSKHTVAESAVLNKLKDFKTSTEAPKRSR